MYQNVFLFLALVGVTLFVLRFMMIIVPIALLVLGILITIGVTANGNKIQAAKEKAEAIELQQETQLETPADPDREKLK